MSNQPFDDRTKAFYQHYFAEFDIHAIPQYSVFSRSRTIDLVVECSLTDLPKLARTVFAHFRRINVVEFKGVHDPLNTIDLNRVMMRAWGIGVVDEEVDKKNEVETKKRSVRATHLSTKEIAEMPDQRTVTIVCVNEPTRVLKTLGHQFHFEPTDEAGIYRSDHLGLSTWIIHPSELTLESRNYPLLPLAKNEKLKQFINLCLAENLVDFLRLTLDIGLITQPDALWQKIMEVMNMKLTIKEETWPYIDEFFREIPEAIQKIPTIQKALAVAVKQAAEQAAKQAAEQATKQGLEQGLEQGSRETLLKFVRRYLEKQLAMPEVDFEETLQALKLDALNQLSEHLFDLETPDETKNYLTELLAQQAHAEMSS